MYGSRKFLSVYVQRNRFAGSRRAHALVAVAGQTFRSGLIDGAPGGVSRFRKQKGENYSEKRRDDSSQTADRVPSHQVGFSHVKLSAMLTSCQDP
jgi:hypothetical protein